MTIPAPGPTALDSATADFVLAMPGLFGWFWEISYDLLIGWALFLLILALVARGRKRMFLDEVFAGAALAALRVEPEHAGHGLAQIGRAHV